MSSDVLIKINLEFEKENKEEVYKILEKKDWKTYLRIESDDWVELEFYFEVFENDVKEFKDVCERIDICVYEYQEGEGFFWENEDDDLQKIVRKKIKKIKEKK